MFGYPDETLCLLFDMLHEISFIQGKGGGGGLKKGRGGLMALFLQKDIMRDSHPGGLLTIIL